MSSAAAHFASSSERSMSKKAWPAVQVQMTVESRTLSLTTGAPHRPGGPVLGRAMVNMLRWPGFCRAGGVTQGMGSVTQCGSELLE